MIGSVLQARTSFIYSINSNRFILLNGVVELESIIGTLGKMREHTPDGNTVHVRALNTLRST